MKLYTYWRSSAAYRVRIALNLKGAEAEQMPVSLKPGEEDQLGDAYATVNPNRRLPAIETEEGRAGQSLAILEWIEETWPTPPLLPEGSWARLKAREFAHLIAGDIHPIQNAGVLKALRTEFGADNAAVTAWVQRWMRRGFDALETMAGELAPAPFLFGERPGIAEICLVPQLYNARRFGVDLASYPNLVTLDERARALEAFARAAPEAQPDAP